MPPIGGVPGNGANVDVDLAGIPLEAPLPNRQAWSAKASLASIQIQIADLPAGLSGSAGLPETGAISIDGPGSYARIGKIRRRFFQPPAGPGLGLYALISITAAAPSFRLEALPAVTPTVFLDMRHATAE